MVVGTRPRHPHFAPYIHHFSSKLDCRLNVSIMRKLTPQRQQISPPFIFAECLEQNAVFSQKLHSRIHENHFFHIFRELFVWPKCTPSIWCHTFVTFGLHCTHSHAFVKVLCRLCVTLTRNPSFFITKFLYSRPDGSTGFPKT